MQIVCRASRHAQRSTGARRSQSSSSISMHKLKQAAGPLRQHLGKALAVDERVVDRVLAVCPNLTQQQQLVAANLSLLHSLNSGSAQVRRLVLSTPHVLTAPIQPWQEFLSAYGLQDSQIWRVLVNQPRLLLHGSIFRAGRAIVFLQQLGWSELEVLTMVIQHPEHSNILLMDVERQLQPVLHYLMQDQRMSQHEAAAFLRSNPGVLYSTGFRERIQQLLRQQRVHQLALI